MKLTSQMSTNGMYIVKNDYCDADFSWQNNATRYSCVLAVNTIPFSLYVTHMVYARTDDLDRERNILIKVLFKEDYQRTLFNFHSFVVKTYRYCLSVFLNKNWRNLKTPRLYITNDIRKPRNGSIALSKRNRRNKRSDHNLLVRKQFC